MDLNVYNHMVGSYTPRSLTKYGTHNDAELRTVLKNIIQITKSSPKYMMHLSEANQKYAVQVKEAAMSLYGAVQDLADDSEKGIFAKKQVYSSNTELASVKMIDSNASNLPEEFELHVNGLAKEQINSSPLFYREERSLSEGTYRFRLRVDEDAYDFQYNIRKNATNNDVLQGLAHFITNAKVGVSAEIVTSGNKKIAMRVKSDMTGSTGEGAVFRFEDTDTSHKKGIVGYYELNEMIQPPENASIVLNGQAKHPMSNQFTIGKSIEITLHRQDEQDSAYISYGPDTEQILDGVKRILATYNEMIDSTNAYQEASGTHSKLMAQMNAIWDPYREEMESCGVKRAESGHMVLDESLAIQACEEGDMEKLFGSKSSFALKTMMKADSIKINPMEYVDKVMINYPNYGKLPAGYSYITSMYSGILFNYYC